MQRHSALRRCRLARLCNESSRDEMPGRGRPSATILCWYWHARVLTRRRARAELDS